METRIYNPESLNNFNESVSNYSTCNRCLVHISLNFRDMEARSDAIPSAQEVDLAVPFSSEQPPIVTFDEWTKEKLKKEEIRKAEQQQVEV